MIYAVLFQWRGGADCGCT